MILIRFADDESERKALAYLAGRFSFKSESTGPMLVPEPALACLARECISFVVEGPAPYERYVPAVRNPAAAAVQ